MSSSYEALIRDLEKLVHRHIRLVDATRRAAVKARRTGDTVVLDERARKLIELRASLERLLSALDSLGSSSGLATLDADSRERLELLLFFLSEVGLSEERALWRYVAKHRESLRGSVAAEAAEAMAKRSAELRTVSLALLEKVKSLERTA
ncbi:MAG: hypothetical protein GXO32_04600 [Crenarchaeota archaeon]|nr:hypothetical protein [Thermoproteota archaeon]